MEQTSKHNPRIDEAMEHDTASLLSGAPVESRAQEERLQEDPGVDAGVRREVREPAGAGIGEPDAGRRADLARHLAAARFPARRDDLVAAAEAEQAPGDVVALLRGLPAGTAFDNVQAVWAAAGGPVEDAHTSGRT